MRLRLLLRDLLPEIHGLTEEEKDPEELLNGLFEKVLFVEPFMTLISLDEKKFVV